MIYSLQHINICMAMTETAVADASERAFVRWKKARAARRITPEPGQENRGQKVRTAVEVPVNGALVRQGT